MFDVVGLGNIVWDIGVIFHNKNDIGIEKGVAHFTPYNKIKKTLESALEEIDFKFSDLDEIEPYKKYKFKEFDFIVNPGGVEANFISNCAKLGLKTAFVGGCGDDILGLKYYFDLMASGVEPYLVSDKGEKTGLLICLVTSDKERTFLVYPGPAEKFLPGKLDKKVIKDSKYLNMSAFTLASSPEMFEEVFKVAKDYKTKIYFDLADKNVVKRNKKKLEDFLSDKVYVLFANEEEGEAFTGESDHNKAVKELLNYSEIAVLKLGEKGSLVSDGKITHHEPAILGNVVDTTGAGDAYGAGFLYGLFKTNKIKTAARYGKIVATEVIRKEGARSLKKGYRLI